MRVTTCIEDGVYSLVEVKMESMFDNGKGRTIQRTDIPMTLGDLERRNAKG